MILPLLVCLITGAAGQLSAWADILDHSSVHPEGIDLRGTEYRTAPRHDAVPSSTDEEVNVDPIPEPQFSWGGLYPHESQTRDRKSLNGIWSFMLSPKNDSEKGFREKWYLKPLSQSGQVIAMAVPSSYNDVTQDRELRDHVGWVWYDTNFHPSGGWLSSQRRVLLRFGSVHYLCVVYVNGQPVTSHEGGHLPFMADVTDVLTYDGPNRLTVAVSNVLTQQTIPQGSVVHKGPPNYPEGYTVQDYDFDFFNYAGIHRSVFLYATPPVHVEDVAVSTSVDTGVDGTVEAGLKFNVTLGGRPDAADVVTCHLTLRDADGATVATRQTCEGEMQVPSPQLWWPHLMHPSPGYLYALEVALKTGSVLVDSYTLNVGIREFSWDSSSLQINGKDLYILGCGKHEDSDIRGKGYDPALTVKDFSLLKWLGANAFRTSHYPYAEEIMDRADAEGILVIDECPAVNLRTFDDELLASHQRVMTELVRRDSNRPSVVMWSVANEPRSEEAAAKSYFSSVANFTRSLDSSRPVTAALNQSPDTDHAGESLDVIFLNRYYSWYSDAGHTELIKAQMLNLLRAWRDLHNKPLGVAEYGADTMIGLHQDPPAMWSEEYQKEVVEQNFAAFDELRKEGFFIGEMFWNFADFMTKQGTTRVGGNRKGVFTRTRQPKTAAFTVRGRYRSFSEL